GWKKKKPFPRWTQLSPPVWRRTVLVSRTRRRGSFWQLDMTDKKSVAILGEGPMTDEQTKRLRSIVRQAMKKKLLILTGDDLEVDAEVIRLTNAARYRRVVVLGAAGVCRVMSTYGKNKAAGY